MRTLAWIAAAVAGFMFLMTMAMASAIGGAMSAPVSGGFDGAVPGLDAEQVRNVTISMTEADRLKAPPLAVLSMVVSGLGESEFRVVFNKQGSGYCGVFQAHPRNIPCDDTRQQAVSFLEGGLGFQAGGAIHLARTRPSLSPGAIATMVEASGQPPSFYDDGPTGVAGAQRLRAEAIVALWRSGAGFVTYSGPSDAGVQDVLNNPRIGLSPGQRQDLQSGGFDERTLATLAWIGQRHSFVVTALRRDHSPGTNHEAGRAIDVGIVDRWICRGGRQDPCADLVRELSRVEGPMRSNELIYCWDPDVDDPGMFARADHCDHLHVGWDGTVSPRRSTPAPTSTPRPEPRRTPSPPRTTPTPDGPIKIRACANPERPKSACRRP